MKVITCTKIVQPPVQILYNPCTNSVHNTNNIITVNKKSTSSVDTVQTDEEQKAAVEFKHILQKLFDNKDLPFSDNFYAELYSSLSKQKIYLSEYGSFLKWAYEECVKHNPRDIYDYFYKTVSKSYFVTKYKMYLTTDSETQIIVEIPKTKCPVCASNVDINLSNCPECNMPTMNFKDKDEIENYKFMFSLPEDLRNKLKDELDSVIFDIRNLRNYRQDRKNILEKYKKMVV